MDYLELHLDLAWKAGGCGDISCWTQHRISELFFATFTETIGIDTKFFLKGRAW